MPERRGKFPASRNFPRRECYNGLESIGLRENSRHGAANFLCAEQGFLRGEQRNFARSEGIMPNQRIMIIAIISYMPNRDAHARLQAPFSLRHGLLRCARNDSRKRVSLRGAQRGSKLARNGG